MTSSSVSGGLDRAADIVEAIEAALASVARTIGTLGVLTMLGGASITILDVILRSTIGQPILGLNEIMANVFAAAVAACIPVGLALKVNLSVDILDRAYSPRIAAALKTFGSAVLLAFFLLLAIHFFGYAETRGTRVSVILRLPELPFIRGVAAMFIFAALIQFVVTLRMLLDLCRPLAGDVAWTPPPGWVRIVGMVFIAIMIAACLATLAAAFDLAAASRFARDNPGLTLGLICLSLWVFLLGLTPISAAMGLLGLFGTVLVIGPGPAMVTFTTEVASFLTRSEVSVLPLYLLMGSFAGVAGMSEDIYRLAQAVFAPLRGGLAYATIGGCAGFGAVTGSSLATAATFGKVALPEMRQRRYSDALAAGSIAAGGTLGQLIPPSTALIVYALLTESSIGQLFIAALVPGLLAVVFYFATIALVVWMKPDAAPAAQRHSLPEILAAARGALGVMVIFTLVIGGLYTGWLTINESAAVGALGAFLFAVMRGKLRGRAFWTVMAETTATTAMIYTLIFGALILSFYAGVSNLPSMVSDWLSTLTIAPVWIVVAIVIGYTMLGMVMDTFAIMLITTPVIAPLISELQYSLVWWGIVMLIVVETGQISPPFGMNLFVLKSVAQDLPLTTIFRGVLPFVISDLFRLALLIAFPIIALWLPLRVF